MAGMTWLVDILRSITFFIDEIVYKGIVIVYNLFMEIANTTLISEDIIDLFEKKVYTLLGIFMLFKVSFSLLTYIANPDQFTDKNKGFSKLISNILISLALLVITPMIFDQAMDIQRIILKENIIPKIFISSSTTSSNTSMQFNLNAGSDISVITYKAFLTNVDGTSIDYINNVYDLFELDVNKKDSSGSYVFAYIPLISTAVGCIEFLLICTYCFDIATRSIKLGFLRMLAPIPIIGRIDPKNGADKFNKWLKTCINTYLDLFIRLAAIYFVIFVISLLF